MKKSELRELIRKELSEKNTGWEAQKKDVTKVYEKAFENLEKYLEKEFIKIHKKYNINGEDMERLLSIVVDDCDYGTNIYYYLYPIDDIE